MPVAFPRACAAAKAEQAEVVLVDLGRPSFLEVEPAAVRAFAAVLEKQQTEAGAGENGKSGKAGEAAEAAGTADEAESAETAETAESAEAADQAG